MEHHLAKGISLYVSHHNVGRANFLLISRLIAIHETLDRKQEEEISPKLDALIGSIAESLVRIKLQENVWLNAQSVVEREIRSLLAEDARCLLSVIHFQRFVSDTLEHELLTTVSDSGISSNTGNWLLSSSSLTLKLSNFRDSDREQGNQYGIELELGKWKQTLQLPISTRQSSSLPSDSWDCLSQWRSLVKQLNLEATDAIGFDLSQQEALKREVACVIVYTAQLLHQYSFVDSFTYP